MIVGVATDLHQGAAGATNAMQQFLQNHANVLGVVGGVFAALLLGTTVRLVAVARLKGAQRRPKLGSLATWWVLWLLVVAATLLAPWGIVVLLSCLSVLGLGEYKQLVDQGGDPRPWYAAYLLAVVQFALAAAKSGIAFWAFLPVAGSVVIVFACRLFGDRTSSLRQAAKISLALFLVVFCLSHAVLLAARPAAMNLVAGGTGWFLFLVLLTEINDIAQALCGRSLGHIPIAPAVSPRKTWEGFLAGVATTVLLAILLAPWLTPYFVLPPQWLAMFGHAAPYVVTALAAIVVAVAGFWGDIAISAVKRSAGAKDSGTLLPGQGGILDRIDSLILSAPAFYYFNWILYRGGGS